MRSQFRVGLIFTALAWGDLGLSGAAYAGTIDLTALDNYARQSVPAYITRSNTPPTNPITDAGATLGRVLFYDRRLSRDDTISCASCHQQSRAFSDTATASTGVNGTTGRHAMRLINAGAGTEAKFFWDERAATLEAQTTRPIQDHAEMGFSGANGDPSLADLITKLSAIPSYRVLFTRVFGDPAITEDRLQRALAQFVRSIQSFDSRYDQGRAQVNGDNATFPNFTAAENAGKQLFLTGPGAGGAGCATCHQAPEFSIDPNSLNNGVTSKIGGGTDLTNTRSPTLRDLVGPGGSSNGAFMHDGSMATLALVIEHYNAIPANNSNLDPRLRRPGGGLQNLNLTQTQKDNLAAFLATLTGSAVYTSAKLSDPFDAHAQLTVNVFATGSVTLQSNHDGTVTLSRHAATGLTYQLQGSTDDATWTSLANVTPDASGQLTATTAPGSNFHFRFALEVPDAAPAIFATSDVASLAIDPPVITASPSSQGVTVGARVELSVTATSAAPLTYQWSKNSQPLTGAAATQATYIIAAFQATDAGSYVATVTNAGGSATTNAAVLSVEKQSQTIAFAPLEDRAFGSGDVVLAASSTSGLAVNFTVVSGPAVLTASGAALSLNGVGTVTVRATQTGNDAYDPAAAIERSFRVTPNLASWQLAHFSAAERADVAISGAAADPDLDGLSNLLEYALGLDPRVASTANLPTLEIGATEWIYHYSRPDEVTDITYTVECSTDLVSWSTEGVTQTPGGATAGFTLWEARAAAPVSGPLFFRLAAATNSADAK